MKKEAVFEKKDRARVTLFSYAICSVVLVVFSNSFKLSEDFAMFFRKLSAIKDKPINISKFAILTHLLYINLMGILKFLLALVLFVIFASVVLFSIGAFFAFVWSVISFLFPFVLAALLIILIISIGIGILQAEKEIKRKQKFRKAVNKDRVPSQFYLY